MRKALKSAVRKLRACRSGFTLIELIAALAISSIVMTSIVSIAVLTYKICNTNHKQADAQNLAVMTIQKIENTVRYQNSVRIYKDKADIDTTEIGSAIYYDDTKKGVNVGSYTYLENYFDPYSCTLTFSNDNTDPGSLLKINIEITDKSGETIYTTDTSVCIMNGSVSGETSGNAITFS